MYRVKFSKGSGATVGLFLKIKESFKNNIPLFHYSIIPCAGQNLGPEKHPLFQVVE